MICDGKRIDFTNVRATDLPHNKDIQMPGPVEINQEIRIQSQRENHMKTVRNYMTVNCDKKGVIHDSEILTEVEKEGKSQIENGIKPKG